MSFQPSQPGCAGLGASREPVNCAQGIARARCGLLDSGSRVPGEARAARPECQRKVPTASCALRVAVAARSNGFNGTEADYPAAGPAIGGHPLPRPNLQRRASIGACVRLCPEKIIEAEFHLADLLPITDVGRCKNRAAGYS